MASLIPGFEYDIFISYRQKDNKYDGWVTEFVSNLKKEQGAIPGRASEGEEMAGGEWEVMNALRLCSKSKLT